jgi:hypothetical protein
MSYFILLAEVDMIKISFELSMAQKLLLTGWTFEELSS